MKTQTPIQVVETYFKSLAAGDLQTLGSLFKEDVIWNQPGSGKLSGRYCGKNEVFGLFGNFMQLSQGSFKINAVDSIMQNRNLVTATLAFSAQKQTGEAISMKGIDLMRIEEGKIAEVTLFSEDQQAEDEFWI